jgi:hypothetical protein
MLQGRARMDGRRVIQMAICNKKNRLVIMSGSVSN